MLPFASGGRFAIANEHDGTESFDAALTAAANAASPQREFVVNRVQWALFLALLAAPDRNEAGLAARLVRPDIALTPLTESADASVFDCGVDMLNEHARRDAALPARADGFGPRFFATAQGGRAIAYYHQRLSYMSCADGNARDPQVAAVPFVLLTRLAIDRNMQGRGIGAAILGDAIRRAIDEDRNGTRAIYVHALSEEVKGFYRRCGFRPVPDIVDPLGLVITLDAARKAVAS